MQISFERNEIKSPDLLIQSKHQGGTWTKAGSGDLTLAVDQGSENCHCQGGEKREEKLLRSDSLQDMTMPDTGWRRSLLVQER